MSTSKSESTALELNWSITLPTGVPLSIILPRIVRTFEDFIKVDIYTGDSDPVYWAIARATDKYGFPWASRFCVAMLTYYHTGTACIAADHEGDDFWEYLDSVYETAPRASERRHFRGHAGKDALHNMRKLYPDANVWFHIFKPTYLDVSRTCQARLCQFGPYFQLKVCDYMMCLGIPITSWLGLERNLPTEPTRALQVMYAGSNSIPVRFLEVVRSVQGKGITAPPWFDREVGPSEVETSLCGWKTSKFKGNWFGADIKDKRESLKGYGGKAKELIEMMPPVPSRNQFILQL